MARVSWKTIEVDKTLGTRREMGTDGKYHTKRTGTMKVPYTYPVVSFKEINSVSDLTMACEEILEAKQAGFLTLRACLEHLNYGLYNNTRAVVARGVDLRYTAQQRNTIKMFSAMVDEGSLEPEIAVTALLRAGISDAQALIDAVVAGESSDDEEPEDEEEASTGK